MNELAENGGSSPSRRRGFFVWCLIILGVVGFLQSLWEVAFGYRASSRIAPLVAKALSEEPEWLRALKSLVGGLLDLLMAWQFFNMSIKVLLVLYATLGWCMIVMLGDLVLNSSLRAFIASSGLLPLLLPIVFNVALIWYAHHLQERGRLGA